LIPSGGDERADFHDRGDQGGATATTGWRAGDGGETAAGGAVVAHERSAARADPTEPVGAEESGNVIQAKFSEDPSTGGRPLLPLRCLSALVPVVAG